MKIGREWIIFIIIDLMTFITCFDGTAINIALPIIAEQFKISVGMVEWVVIINTLTIVCTILSYGRLGDIKGKKFIFELGIGIFIFGEICTYFSYNFMSLIIARIIAGVGSSAIMATNQGLITETFSPNHRGKALGIHGSVVAVGAMLGPSAGGALIDLFSWKAIFMIGVPLCFAGLMACVKILPKSSTVDGVKLDKVGAGIFAIFIASLYMSLKNLQYGKERYIFSVFILMVAIICGWLFYKVESKEKEPMLDLSMFKNKIFTISLVCSAVSFFAIATNSFIMPFYLQRILGYTPSGAGMLLMIYPLVMMVTAPISGTLADKVGSEILCVIGLAVASAGIFGLSFLNESTSVVYFAICTGISSMGFALFQSPNTTLIMNTVARDKMGMAGSLNGLVRNLGNIFGISISMTLLYALISTKVGYHTNDLVVGREDAFVFAMSWVYRLSMVMCLIGLSITLLRYINKKKKA